jgi:hypothetical protein
VIRLHLQFEEWLDVVRRERGWCEGEKTIRNKNLAASAATNDTMSSNGRDEAAPDTLCRS